MTGVQTCALPIFARGATAIYLLTLDGAAFFAKLGYAACERARVPILIAATAEFAGIGPDSTTAMTKPI